MTDKTVSINIEILGKFYPVRCTEAELPSLQQAAEYLNKKMFAVQESGKAINLERIAIITALNIAHELLQSDGHKLGLMDIVNQRIHSLQDKLDKALHQSLQTELVYSAE